MWLPVQQPSVIISDKFHKLWSIKPQGIEDNSREGEEMGGLQIINSYRNSDNNGNKHEHMRKIDSATQNYNLPFQAVNKTEHKMV